jgi:Alpha/beta hydrolase domain/alpha/beta hydrolase fold
VTFTQAVRSVGPGRDEQTVDPMAGLDVERVFATGASQSAMRLTSYLDGVQPIEHTLDGVVLLVSFGRSARFETTPGDEGNLQASFLHSVRIRDDLGIPVLHVSTETEADALYPVRQPDTDTFRTWEIAGAAHASATGGIPALAAHPERAVPFDTLSPELLELARGPIGAPPTREIADITDDLVEGVPAGATCLRDEGRAYAARLRDQGVDVEEVCCPGQPHGFVNFDFPGAGDAYARIGAWVRSTLARATS